jgi:hypothetical protein
MKSWSERLKRIAAAAFFAVIAMNMKPLLNNLLPKQFKSHLNK